MLYNIVIVTLCKYIDIVMYLKIIVFIAFCIFNLASIAVMPGRSEDYDLSEVFPNLPQVGK